MSKSIRETLCARAEKHGLCKHEADVVADALAALPEMQNMQGRWTDAALDYPLVMINALWMAYCHAAEEWLASNKPKHFARQMIAGYLSTPAPKPEG